LPQNRRKSFLEEIIMKRIRYFALVFFAAPALIAWAQDQSTVSQPKTIKNVPIKYTSPTSGQEMYKSYCAACHGKTGKGDGPAASALKQPPPDLTALASNNNGKFPGDRVAHVLGFGVGVPAHGTKDMPIWGPLLGSLQGSSTTADALVQLRIANLTKYIESLQSK
jgi:mono/diheme cytochrome c family protein